MITKVSIYRTRTAAALHDEAARRCSEVLAAQPGFVGRILGRNAQDDAECVEAIQWESAADARAAFTAASANPAVQSWLEHVELPSVKMYSMGTSGVVSRSERSLADRAVSTWLLVRWQTLAGVDDVSHTRNELLMHHEAFAPAAGYLGAHILQQLDGPERMELIAWPDLDTARTRVEEILGAGHALVANHMADCAPGASLHFVSPILRA
jgi:heme-degrading monooxygenase HmoA